MQINLLDKMLDTYQAGQTPVTVTLQNKIRVSGRIKAFDSYVIIIDGQKREIVYRHAVSSIATGAGPEQKRRDPVPRPASIKAITKAPAAKARPAQHQTLSAATETNALNNTLKDGLLKWMQGQKAAK